MNYIYYIVLDTGDYRFSLAVDSVCTPGQLTRVLNRVGKQFADQQASTEVVERMIAALTDNRDISQDTYCFYKLTHGNHQFGKLSITVNVVPLLAGVIR